MKELIRKILIEETEENVLVIPGLTYFGEISTPEERYDTWNRVLEFAGDRKFKINGNLFLSETLIQSLGNLKSVGGNLYLARTPIESLGRLQSVGGDLLLRYTPLSKRYSEEEIRQMVNVEGNIYL